ncbi:FUSC family protein [Desulfotalea psychrophila]|uniref:Hypothetical membrane protein n=1 Tax=Desulfotalea psychrophila (strain LSv54 / DSM 12343) TaxID=177439 RepID=Q6AJ83_DESPS|nr:FUSC family protein [Desulfotalea psychrophila]CAG37597.1 hypothetical membrane protein [Desulfotalea psychrophila LSv54]
MSNHYEHFIIKYHNWLRVFRVLVAFTAILTIVLLAEVPYGTWALITPITLMGTVPYTGGVLFIAKQRILGTAIGAAVGLSLFLIPVKFELLHYISFVFTVAGAIYFAQKKYPHAAVIVALTIVIIAGAGPYDLSSALWRTFNIFWSALISLACAFWLLPSRAIYHYFDSIKSFLSACLDVYCEHNQQMKDGTAEPILLESLSARLGEQRKLLQHVKEERPEQKEIFLQLLVIERRILTMVEILVLTRWSRQKGRRKIEEMEGLVDAKNQLAGLLDGLIEGVEGKSVRIIEWDDIALLHVVPEAEGGGDVGSDISWFGYLWINRELARQLAGLSLQLKRFYDSTH